MKVRHLISALLGLTTATLALNARADITTGLVGYWKFDEGSGSTANDSTTNANTGTLTNFADTSFTSMWTPNGWYNDAILFNTNNETTN